MTTDKLSEKKEEILQSNGVYLSGKIDGPTHEAILKSMDDWAAEKLLPTIKKDFVLKEDDICPFTDEQCDDEYCTPGSVCNFYRSDAEDDSMNKQERPQITPFDFEQLDKTIKEMFPFKNKSEI